MNDLASLLDQGVPEPQASLDPDALLRRAHRRRSARRVGGLMAVTSVAVLVGVTALAPGSPHPAAPGFAGSLTLSALDHAVALPPDLLALEHPWDSGPHQPSGLGVVARRTGLTTIYLSTAKGDSVCLILQYPNGGGGTGCRAIADLLTHPLSVVMQWTIDQPVEMALVMPDGYTTLTIGSDTATAASNVAYLPAITSTRGVISGPHVESQEIDLGPYQLPSAGAGSSTPRPVATGPARAVPSGSPVAYLPYPVNAHGMTYGSLADAPTHGAKAPDLVAAIGLDKAGAHVEGYFRHVDMPVVPEPKNPAEAGVLMAKAIPPKTVPLYAVDGTTVIGSFTFVGRPASSSRG
jgi:hypothetical protein